jgi:hypothetical protein
MSVDIPVDKKFKILSEIARAQHFAWRQAVAECFPGTDTKKVVYKMWEITGHETARAYLKRLDPKKPLPKQIADSMAWSSVSMGEDAVSMDGRDENEAFLRHSACPWFEWHKRLGLLEEDQPGCDMWFKTIVEDINKTLSTKIRIETSESLPEGGHSCIRRIWVQK